MPFCVGGVNNRDVVTRKGWRFNKGGFAKQIWKCNSCNRRFTLNDGFWKMKHSPETIAEAIDLYEVGHSLMETSRHLWKHRGVLVSPVSVRNWVKKYGKLISAFTQTFLVVVKKRIHEDEVEVCVNKKKRYFWRAKDSVSGFKFSGPVGRRTLENCMRLNRQIKKRCYECMLERKNDRQENTSGDGDDDDAVRHHLQQNRKLVRFVSDKLPHYKSMHNKLFRYVTKITHGVPIKGQKNGLRYNNNVIECEHGSVNIRIQHMHGADDLDFVQIVLHLKDALDNFTRRRNKKRKTPAELAGINIDLSRNTTLSLIYLFLHRGLEDFR